MATLGIAALAACTANSAPVVETESQTSPDKVPTASDDTLRLALGAEATAARGRVTVRFLERVSDDRCPANVICIRAGDAKVRLRVHTGAESQEATIGIYEDPKAIRAEGYSVTVLELAPYPGLHGEGDPQPSPSVVVRVHHP